MLARIWKGNEPLYTVGGIVNWWSYYGEVLEKTLESPLDYKKIKLLLKEINPEYSLEGLMLKLKLQYVCHLI